MAMEDQLKQWLGHWQKNFEVIQSAFKEGRVDLAELFELQKDLLRKAIQQWKEGIESIEDKTDAGIKDISASMEKLLEGLNAGKVHSMAAFEEQRRQIEGLLNHVKSGARSIRDENYGRLMQVFEQNSLAFKTALEVIQLQFVLANAEAAKRREEVNAEIMDKINSLNANFLEYQKIGMEQMETWRKHMQQGYEQMNVWVEDWLKKLKH